MADDGSAQEVRVTVPSGDSAPRHRIRIVAVLAVLMAFASMSTDLYLPALPTMGRDLRADVGTMEWTITGFLAGFSVGQLVWGPLGDRYGRRLPIAAGLILFVAGSVMCALATDARAMIGWRIVQAFGACSGVVLARAMVRDLYDRDRAARMMSILLIVMGVAPLVGPLAGGAILRAQSWRAIFWLLVGIGVATLAAVLTLPETLPPARRNPDAVRRALTGYAELLKHRPLIGYAVVGGFYFAGVFAYVAGTPFAYMTFYGVSTTSYALLFGIAIIGIMASNVVNARLVVRLGTDPILRTGTVFLAFAGLAAGLAAGTGWGGLPTFAAALILFISTSGLIVANSIAGALAHFPERAGAASALVGAAQFGSGIVGSGLVGALADGTPRPLGWIMAACGLGSLLSARLLLPRIITPDR